LKRMPTRAARLATAVSIAGVAALSAGPAFADSNINYFQGGGTGQAVNLQVTPSTILNGVDLSAVQSAINASRTSSVLIKRLFPKESARIVSSVSYGALAKLK